MLYGARQSRRSFQHLALKMKGAVGLSIGGKCHAAKAVPEGLNRRGAAGGEGPIP